MNGIFLRKAGTRCLATLALVATCSAAQAAWPERPIKLIVGFTAGGGADGVARVLADSMGKTLGQAVIVENRPGAGTTLAASVVAKSPPDGYTLMLVTSTNTISPAMYKAISYKPASDFVMIGMIGRGPTLIAVPKSSGITTLAELIDRARNNPGKINYGAGGIGTTQHLGALVLQRDAGISMTHIPYKGGSETAAALLGGQLDVQFGTPPSIAPVLPKVNILASTMGKRTTLAPGVPAVSETVKGFDVASWYALGGPAGMPANAVTKLAGSLRTALADAKLQKQLNTLGLEPDTMSTESATTFYREELDRWAAIVRKEGLKADD